MVVFFISATTLFRWSANHFLIDYHIELNELELDDDFLKQLVVGNSQDFIIELKKVSFTHQNSRVDLSNITLHLSMNIPFYLKSIELERGNAVLNIDEISALIVQQQQLSQGYSAEASFDFSKIRNLPHLYIHSFDFTVDPLSDTSFSIKDSAVDLGATTHATALSSNTRIQLYLNEQVLLTSTVALVNEQLQGHIVIDLANVQRVIEKNIYLKDALHSYVNNGLYKSVNKSLTISSIGTFTGTLTSDFTLSNQNNTWQLLSDNLLSEHNIHLSSTLNTPFDVPISLMIEGRFNVNYAESLLVLSTPINQPIKLSLNPSMTESLIEGLSTLPSELSHLVLNHLNSVFYLDITQPLTLGVLTNSFTGGINITRNSESGALKLSLVDMEVSEQKFSSQWQLLLNDNGTLKQAERLNLGSSGQFYYQNTDSKIIFDRGSQLTLSQINMANITAEHLTIEMEKPAVFKLNNGVISEFEPIEFTSNIQNLSIEQFNLHKLSGHHRLFLSTAGTKMASDWLVNDKTPLTSQHNYEKGFLKGDISLANVALADIADRLPLPSNLIAKGEISSQVTYRLDLANVTLSAQLQGKLIKGKGHYNDIRFTDASAQWQCSWQQQKLTCRDNVIHIKSISAGFDINHMMIEYQFVWQNEQWELVVNQFNGDIFDGRFSSDEFTVLPNSHIKANLTLAHISLNDLVALQQQEGITANGYLNGKLPFTYENGRLTINNGRLINQGPGIIKIDGNPAVEQLKLAQPDLKFALDALKELNFDVLSCGINMLAGGDTKIEMKLEGKNPTITRPIHFNYLHDENLIQLFRSLQVGNVFDEQLSKSVK